MADAEPGPGAAGGNDSLLWMAVGLVLLVAALAGVLVLARGG